MWAFYPILGTYPVKQGPRGSGILGVNETTGLLVFSLIRYMVP